MRLLPSFGLALRAAGSAAAVAVALWAGAPAEQPSPVSTGGCSASWCRPGAVEGQAQALVDEQLAVLTAGRNCWAPGERAGVIPATVLVKGAERDRSVVWPMSLDAAFAVNGDGDGDSWDDVVVVAACDAG